MAKPTPSSDVIDLSAGTGGLVHVGVFLNRALGEVFGRSDPAMEPAEPTEPIHAQVVLMSGIGLAARADLLKCDGAGLECCARCSRKLAPIAPENQRWVDPSFGPSCHYFADVEKVYSLYSEMTEHEKVIMEENRIFQENEQK